MGNSPEEGEGMIQAVFFDIDGTIQSMITHEIPPLTLKALYRLKEKGIRVFPCSGRTPIQIQILCQSFQDFPWDGYVFLNGQYCMDETRQTFYDNPINPKAFETLIPYLKTVAYPVTFMERDYSYDIRFNEHSYAYFKAIHREDKMTPIDDMDRAYTHPTYQVCPVIPPEQDPAFLAHAPYIKSARWTDAFADMIPIDGGKPVGMKHMLAYYGMELEQAMAFGDGGNDIDMLKAAQIGVAMGNGKDDVKQAADYVTDTCEKEGVYKALKHFGLLD
jgi:Cof subfamily protein (haloacid dehalogenase superfamily)